MSDLVLNTDTRPVADGRFDIRERLSESSPARVYRAWDRETEQTVALKFLDLEERPGSNEELHRRKLRFAREARILEKLRACRQVVDLVAADTETDSPWIAMEYLQGRTLRALIDDNPGEMTLPQFLILSHEIVTGLHGIHSEGILHRDLSPDNILVFRGEDRIPRVKFLDFGIGKPLQGEEQPVTQMPTLMGKPQYIAPEHGRSDHAAGSDVYALGVILYEMLAGEIPIQVSSFAELARIRREEPVPLAAHDQSRRVPEELRALIMACLAKSGSDRPTLDELSECLAELRRRHESGEDLAADFSQWEISRLDAGLKKTRTVLEPRVLVSHYRTEWMLSREGATESWLARDDRDETEICLEVTSGTDEELTARLTTLEGLRPFTGHENVQRVFEFGRTERFAWAALELVRGSTLKEVLARGKPLAPGQILQISQGIIEGLIAIHEEGFVHGQLRPDNVLLDEFDSVKLRGMNSNPNLRPPNCQQAAGAQAAWQSPEVLLGAAPAPTSDLYSFGTLLFAMITGESPFEGSDMAQAYQHVNSAPANVLLRNPDFRPADLDRVVMWLLNKNPDRRPQTAKRLREAVMRCFSRNPAVESTSVENAAPDSESADHGPWLSRIWRRRNH